MAYAGHGNFLDRPLILEVPCQSSASCVIKPSTAKTGNAGIATEPCRPPRTQVTVDALQNTFGPDAMEAKTLPETLWQLVGSATAAGTVERRRSQLKIIGSSFVSDSQRGGGSMPTSDQRPEVGKSDVSVRGTVEPALTAGMGRGAFLQCGGLCGPSVP